ncbi:MAG: hypothetical protein JXD18_11635, partial [Anaerolineae bacterium]|nr:hypothetical protein [Anaerolineae bacterium]
YFPVAFLVKTPLPTLLALLLSLLTLVLGRRRSLRDELALALFPLTYAAFSLTSTINIGYRHLLPLLPFLFVGLGRIRNCELRIASRGPRTLIPNSQFLIHHSQFLIWGLTIWLAITVALLSPHYLTFFNEIADGPGEGYRFLADSNTDWGQTLKALADYQDAHNLGPVQLSLFTFLDPAAYGVEYTPIAPMAGAPPVLPRRFNPAPGVYAISATTLDGVPLPLPSTYDWFRHRPPHARVGHATFVYQVPESAGEWVAQCTQPVPPLTSQAIVEGFGSDGLRQIAFDCEQSWVFPAGGATPGWYARATPGIDRLRWPTDSEHLEWWPEWARHLPLDALHLNYVQPTPGDLPAFATWEWPTAAVAPPTPVAPVELEGALAFLGVALPEAAAPGAQIDVLTYWRVVDLPAAPLSLMLHLTGADGVPIAVGDGLGVPIDQWQVSDIIIQRHRLSVPEDTPAGVYQVRAGVYWLDTMERWYSVSGQADVIFSLEVDQ